MTEAPPEHKYSPAFWLADEQIYSDSFGDCWGIMPGGLESVCLGTSEHVKQVLESKTIPKNQCKDAGIVLESILKNIEEEKELAKPKPKSKRLRRYRAVRGRPRRSFRN